jgi:hypothetical protein
MWVKSSIGVEGCIERVGVGRGSLKFRISVSANTVIADITKVIKRACHIEDCGRGSSIR